MSTPAKEPGGAAIVLVRFMGGSEFDPPILGTPRVRVPVPM